MKQEVFEPLGMNRTAILTEPGHIENVALKYDLGKREFPVCDFDNQGSSAAYGSVHDLVRFGIFHLSDNVQGKKRIFKKDTLVAMHNESGSEFMDGDKPVKYLLGSFTQFDHLGYRFQLVTGGMPGAVSGLDIIPFKNIISGLLANAENVDLWALQHEIFGALLPAFRNTPNTPPKAADVGATEKFSPPDPLVGIWKGTIRTSFKAIRARLTFARGGQPTLEIDGKNCSPLSIKTELGPISFKEGVFIGLF